jgi:hypothetical protein
MRNNKKLSAYAKMVIVFWVLFIVMFGGFFISCLIEVNMQNDSALYGRSYSYSENNIFIKMLTALDKAND